MLSKSLLLLLVLILPAALLSQDQNYDLFRVQYHYERVELNQAIEAGRKALQQSQNLAAGQLAELHKYMAFAFFNLSQKDSARFHFFSLLSLQPNYQPDRAEASPKLRDFFADIKRAFNENRVSSAQQPLLTRYVFIPDKRPQAAWRSLLLPGWGQYYKGQKSRAYIVGGSVATLSLATVSTYLLERSYRDDYLASNNAERIPDLYDRYNSAQKWRKGLLLTTAVFWIWNVGDALWATYPELKLLNEDTPGISLKIKF